MFSTIRNVTFIVFIALILLTLLLSIYFKHAFISGVIKTSVEQQVVGLAGVYSKQVWDHYYPVINFINEQPANERETYPQYLAFISESQGFFNSDKLIKTVIYNTTGETLFDSDKGLKLQEKSTYLGSFFDSVGKLDAQNIAKKDRTESFYAPNIFIQEPNNNKRISVIKVFVPILASNVLKLGPDLEAAKAKGVIEFNYDISDSVRSVDAVQYSLVITFALCLCIILGTIVIGSKKAEQFVEKQQELGVELAAARASAEADSKAKSQFLANVTHELRTPLNAIIGFSEIISSEAMGPINNEQYKEFIKDIHTSGVHLLSLINDILDFSKAEANKLDVVLEDIDLTKLATICVRMLTPRAEEAKVKLKEEMPSEHIIVKLDSKRVKQVILNLLTNAVKFTSENGDVVLKLAKDPQNKEVIIQVRDTGIGMAPQDLARAFAPFGQIDSKLSRKREGTGLGLPLTKKLVELMKGKFDIKSEVGIGTTVTLAFPISESVEKTSNGPQTNPVKPVTA